MKRVISRSELPKLIRRLRRQRQRIVFTNGVFDILHRGHVDYLTRGKRYGDVLIVGINSDASVRRLKGKSRPLQRQADRAAILQTLRPVDYVVIFGQATPIQLIKLIRPDILLKGADYKLSDIVGADEVRSWGGRVVRMRLTPGRSTSELIRSLE